MQKKFTVNLYLFTSDLEDQFTIGRQHATKGDKYPPIICCSTCDRDNFHEQFSQTAKKNVIPFLHIFFAIYVSPISDESSRSFAFGRPKLNF